MSVTPASPDLVRFAEFELDLSSGELWRNGTGRVLLPDQPFRMLAALIRRSGTLVTRDDLRRELWSEGTFVDFEHSLNAATKRLREALGDSATTPRFIETLPKRGYRFIAAIEERSSPSASNSPATTGPRLAGGADPAADMLAVNRRPRMVTFAHMMAAAAGLTVAALIGWESKARLATHAFQADAGPPAPRSIAVLPFKAIVAAEADERLQPGMTEHSAAAAQDYFADGMTEALITELAKVRALRVTSRTSVMSYKRTRLPMPAIARALGVDAVVEGSVIREGERIRITAQLIEGATDRHLWAESYERDARDALSLQREVALAIAREVRAQVSPEEAGRLATSRSIDPRANEAYLRGRYFFEQSMNRSESESGALRQRTIDSYQEALRLEPSFAEAWAALARCYHWMASAGEVELYPKAKAAALEALKIDETVAEAHSALAFTVWRSEWDWRGAERSFRRALELGASETHHGYALFLSAAGRHGEAVEHIRLAEQLDPLSLPLKVNVGAVYQQARLYDRALEQFRHALAVEPELNSDNRVDIGSTLVLMGRCPEGLAELRGAARAEEANLYYERRLAWGYALCGAREAAERLLARKAKAGVQDQSGMVDALGALGRRDEAFGLLEKSFSRRDQRLVHAVGSPFMDPLRSDPRFADLVRRIGVPVIPSP